MSASVPVISLATTDPVALARDFGASFARYGLRWSPIMVSTPRWSIGRGR